MSDDGRTTPDAGVGPRPLSGKNCVVMGIQNRWSIAYAISEQMAEAGANIAVTYVDERAGRDALGLAEKYGGKGYTCNVESDEELDALGAALARDFGRVDALVHSIAFAPAAEMQGRFLETSREGFRVAHSVSVYSLIAAAQRVEHYEISGYGTARTFAQRLASRTRPRCCRRPSRRRRPRTKSSRSWPSRASTPGPRRCRDRPVGLMSQ